jgi:hypothetical protein
LLYKVKQKSMATSLDRGDGEGSKEYMNIRVQSTDPRSWQEWEECEICCDPTPKHQLTWVDGVGAFCLSCIQIVQR